MLEDYPTLHQLCYAAARPPDVCCSTLATHASSLHLPAGAALNSSDSKEAKEVFTKVLSRLALFGALPPSILPALVSVRTKVDLPKTADRKLLRIVNYLIQLVSGEGSAGTVVPFSTLLGKRQSSSSGDGVQHTW
jgi:hypothetical protein